MIATTNLANLDASRQVGHGPNHILSKQCLQKWLLDLTRGCLLFVDDVEDRAILDKAGEVGALVDGSLEEFGIPTRHEVAMVAIS